jgi:hypothetical protein
MDAEMMMRASNARRETSTPSSSLPPFYTRKETARELRMSVTKLDRVIARGELKAKKHGHSVVVLPSEIERYIKELPDLQPRAERGAR